MMDFIRWMGRIAFTGALVGFANQQAGQAPGSLLTATGVAPELFGVYLAAARIPGGVELRDADRSSLRTVKALPHSDNSVSVEQLVAAFNSLHADYRAQLVDGAVVVAPTTGPSVLDQRAAAGRIVGKGLMQALRALFAPLDPRLKGVAAGISAVSRSVDRGDDVDVDLDTSAKTVREVLTELAQLAPGNVWLVIVSGKDGRISQVGFIHSDGSTSTLTLSQTEP